MVGGVWGEGQCVFRPPRGLPWVMLTGAQLTAGCSCICEYIHTGYHRTIP